MPEKIPYIEFSAKIKEKYPEYKDVDDFELSTKMVEKYPEYKDSVDLTLIEPEKKNGVSFGYSTPQEAIASKPLKQPSPLISNTSQSTLPSSSPKELVSKIKELAAQPNVEPTPENDYISRLGDRAIRGMNSLNSMLAKTPEFIYNVAAIPQNIVAEQFDIPTLAVSADKVKKDLGISNEVAKYYDNEVSKLAYLDAKYSEQQNSIVQLVKSGKYSDAAKLLGEQIVESLPTTAAIAATGGLGASPTAITLGGGGVFGAGKYDELKDREDLTEAQKSSIAFSTGLVEGLFENLGTANLGRVAKDIFLKEGAEVAKTQIKKTFIEAYKEGLKKYLPISGAISEGLEEAATQFAQNAIDVYGGVDPNKKLTDGVMDAFIVGAGSGAVISSPTLLSKKNNEQVVKKQQEVDNLDADIAKENVPDEVKAELMKSRQEKMEEINNIVSKDTELQKSLPEDTKREIEALTEEKIQLAQGIDSDISDESKAIIAGKIDAIDNQIETITNEVPKSNIVSPTDVGQQQITATTNEAPNGGVEGPRGELEQGNNGVPSIGTESTDNSSIIEPTTSINETETTKNTETEQPSTESVGVSNISEPSTTSSEEVKVEKKEIKSKDWYHGSDNNFTTFENKNPRMTGFWFSDNQENASTYGKNIKKVRLDVNNPLIIDANGKKFTDNIEVEVLAKYPNEKPYLTKVELDMDEIVWMVKNGKRKNSFIEIPNRSKYDAVVFKNVIDPSLSSRNQTPQTSIAVLNNSQITESKPNVEQINEGGKNATKEGNIEKSTVREYSEGNKGGEKSEAGNRNRLLNAKKKQEKVADSKNALKRLEPQTAKDFIAIKLNGMRIKTKSFLDKVGSAYMNPQLRLTYLNNNKGESLNQIAHDLKQEGGIFSNIDEADIEQMIADFIIENPAGPRQYANDQVETRDAELKRYNEEAAYAEKLANELEEEKRRQFEDEVDASWEEIENRIDDMSDEDFAKIQQEIIYEQLKTETNENINKGAGENLSENKSSRPNISKAERKSIAEAKIDEVADLLKDLLPSAKGVKKSGIGQDEVIDLIAKAVKALVNTGIDIQEAIKQVKERLSERFNVDDIKDFDIKMNVAKNDLKPLLEKEGITYRQAIFTVNKYLREVGKDDVITEDELKEALKIKKEKGEVRESGRSKSYEEERVPVSEEYRKFVDKNKVSYTAMDMFQNADKAIELLETFGGTEKGLQKAYDYFIDVYDTNPYLNPANAVAIELLSDRLFAKGNEAYKNGDTEQAEKYFNQSNTLRLRAFNAATVAGQYNAALAVFARSVNPDAFLYFVNKEVEKANTVDESNTYSNTVKKVKKEKAQSETKEFKKKAKDIATTTANDVAKNITDRKGRKPNERFSKLKERGVQRQKDALDKLKRLGYLGSSGLNNEAIEAIGELVLSQLEIGIYKAATIVQKIKAMTDGKVTDEHLKDVFDTYKATYDGKEYSLTELAEVLEKEYKLDNIDVEKELEKEKAKQEALKSKEKLAQEKLIETERLKRIQNERKASGTLQDELAKERARIAEQKAKEKIEQQDRIEKLALERAIAERKASEERISELKKRAKDVISNKKGEPKKSLSDLVKMQLSENANVDTMAKEIMNEFDVSEQVAQALANKYVSEYKRLLTERINKELQKSLGIKNVKEIEKRENSGEVKPYEKTLGGKIVGEIMAGALDSGNAISDAFAQKYGFPVLTPTMQNNIRLLSARANEAKTFLGQKVANRALITYLQSILPTSTTSVLNTIYYVSLLSGVTTAAVNTIGNIYTLVNQNAENLVQSIIEAAQGEPANLISTVKGKDKLKRSLTNFNNAITTFLNIMHKGGGESKYYNLNQKALDSFDSERLVVRKEDFKNLGLKRLAQVAGKIWYTAPAIINRNLPASDDAFSSMNFNMEAAREVRKDLAKTGLKGAELENAVFEQVYGTPEIQANAIIEAKKEVARIGIDPASDKRLVKRIAFEIIQNNLDTKVQNTARALAAENTYRGVSRGLTGYIGSLIPQNVVLAPFVTTVMKIAEKMVNYIPFYGIQRASGFGLTDIIRKSSSSVDKAFARKGIDYGKRTGEMRNKQIAQVVLSHAVLMTAYALTKIGWYDDEDGEVKPLLEFSGGYLGVPQSKREKLEKEMPMYTMRFMGTKINYTQNPLLAMIGVPLSINADLKRAGKEELSAEKLGSYFKWAMATSIYILNATPVQPIQQFFSTLGKSMDETSDTDIEDVAKQFVRSFGGQAPANIIIPNTYKQLYDFFDPQKFDVNTVEDALWKSFNMERIGELEPSYDWWGRDIKQYPAERTYPLRDVFSPAVDPVDKWGVKNDITIPNINRKTLVLDLESARSYTKKAYDKKIAQEAMDNLDEYGDSEIESEANYRLLTQHEWAEMDKTVRQKSHDFIADNLDKVKTKEYGELYLEKPFNKMTKKEAESAVRLLFKQQRMDYIHKNFKTEK